MLDSNICVYILRGRKGMREQLQKVGWDNCCISEMTVAELLYGAECSSKIEENKKEVLSFCADIEIIPIGLALSEYASPKSNIKKERKFNR